jgi:hypothetical protein
VGPPRAFFRCRASFDAVCRVLLGWFRYGDPPGLFRILPVNLRSCGIWCSLMQTASQAMSCALPPEVCLDSVATSPNLLAAGTYAGSILKFRNLEVLGRHASSQFHRMSSTAWVSAIDSRGVAPHRPAPVFTTFDLLFFCTLAWNPVSAA